jgi:D-cysteine desulfhydrase
VIGEYPTPVELHRLPGGEDLWIKRDDRTASLYGGNKVRKLERLLVAAREADATELLTVGAVGSHHVLATTLFGRRAGFRVTAVLLPQPRTDHVAANLRAGIGAGLHAVAAGSYAEAAVRMTMLRRRGGRRVFVIPPGGSNGVGTLGFVDAGDELARQIASGDLPEPAHVVVPLGSGGTAAGLAVAFARAGLRSRVVGVVVAKPQWLLGLAARRLAYQVGAQLGGRVLGSAAQRHLSMEGSAVGAGYGAATAAGNAACIIARSIPITLDDTYTAKAFACAMAMASPGAHPRGRASGPVLFWHTLSAAQPSLEDAPEERHLALPLQRLLR